QLSANHIVWSICRRLEISHEIGKFGRKSQYLLNEKAAVNCLDEYRQTSLLLALEMGHIDIIKRLVDKGATVETTGWYGQIPLHLALKIGYFDVVHHFLEKGVAVNTVDETPMHLASRNGYLDVIEHLLDKGAAVDRLDRAGQTPLHLASSNGHLNVAMLLLNRGVIVNRLDNESHSPLHLASMYGHAVVVKGLIENGAVVDLADKDGWTSLHFAINSKDSETVFALLDAGADMTLETNDGKSVRSHCNDETLEAILDKVVLLRRCFGKDMVPILAKNPITVAFLADSKLHATLQDLQRFPSKFYKYKNDARILTIFAELEKQNTSVSIKSTESQFVDQVNDTNMTVIYSIQSAFEVIRKTIQDIKVIMVGRIMNYMIQDGIPMQDSNLLQTLHDIKLFWESTLQTTHPWKLFIYDNCRQAAVHVEYMGVHLNVQVVGSFSDAAMGIENMMKTMRHLDHCLESIMNFSHFRQQTDKLLELTIQLKRGLEHYMRQVDVGNIERNKVFEVEVMRCQNQIEERASTIAQPSKLTRYSIDKIESWMLSSDDVHFDPKNISSALGRGGFATVFTGIYHGQMMAVKRFYQIVLADSTDLEKLIVKEVKEWKDILMNPIFLP
ncbi:hypothetical protein AeRB84_013632, partial [Aphanomyces euteiches]